VIFLIQRVSDERIHGPIAPNGGIRLQGRLVLRAELKVRRIAPSACGTMKHKQ
jgi:hypothetical protein